MFALVVICFTDLNLFLVIILIIDTRLFPSRNPLFRHTPTPYSFQMFSLLRNGKRSYVCVCVCVSVLPKCRILS